MTLGCLGVNIISLIVSLATNVTATMESQDDSGYGANLLSSSISFMRILNPYRFGWIIATLAPGISCFWCMIDVVLCHFLLLRPIYSLVASAFLMLVNVVLGSLNIASNITSS